MNSNPDYEAIVDTFGHLIAKVNPSKTKEGLIDLDNFFLRVGMVDNIKTRQIVELVDSGLRININQIFIGASSKANLGKMACLINMGANINYDNSRALYLLIWNKKFMRGKDVDKYDRAIDFLLENGIKISENVGAMACMLAEEKVVDYILQGRNLTKIEMQILSIFSEGDTPLIHDKRVNLIQRLIDSCLIDPNILCKYHFKQSLEKDKSINKNFLLLMQKNDVNFNYVLDNLLKKKLKK